MHFKLYMNKDHDILYHGTMYHTPLRFSIDAYNVLIASIYLHQCFYILKILAHSIIKIIIPWITLLYHGLFLFVLFEFLLLLCCRCSRAGNFTCIICCCCIFFQPQQHFFSFFSAGSNSIPMLKHNIKL